MSIVGWLVLGVVAGVVASKMVNKRGKRLSRNIVLGIVGSVFGGFVFSFFGAAPATGLSVYSMLVAIVGAAVVLFIYHAATGRRRAYR